MEKYYYWIRDNWLNLLIFFYLFFIVYLTVLPFRFTLDPAVLHRNWQKIQWIPFYKIPVTNQLTDAVGNVIFFIPLGILLVLKRVLKYYRPLYRSEWLRLALTGFLTSLFVEVLQYFTENRSPATHDVAMNTLGTILGAAFMLAIYLKFRQQIKAILFELFVEKNEMIIAAFFFIFIFISQSTPFTFSLFFYSLKIQLHRLFTFRYSPDYLLDNLLYNLITYGAFTYFLLSGLNRYFRARLNKAAIFRIIAFLVILPLLIEFYQILLPARHHSFIDVIFAYIGMVFGYAQFRFQNKSNISVPQNSNHISDIFRKREAHFFIVLGILYLVFLTSRFFVFEETGHLVFRFKSVFAENIREVSYLARPYRVQILIAFLKEVFAFLPAGFILSLLLDYSPVKRPIKRLIWIGLIILPLLILWYVTLFVIKVKLLWLNIPATGLGIWTGYICWHIYNFMQSRQPK
jgi:glycopeptide antibiotics resistance protein